MAPAAKLATKGRAIQADSQPHTTSKLGELLGRLIYVLVYAQQPSTEGFKRKRTAVSHAVTRYDCASLPLR